jgi:hypothetical protein
MHCHNCHMSPPLHSTHVLVSNPKTKQKQKHSLVTRVEPSTLWFTVSHSTAELQRRFARFFQNLEEWRGSTSRTFQDLGNLAFPLTRVW